MFQQVLLLSLLMLICLVTVAEERSSLRIDALLGDADSSPYRGLELFFNLPLIDRFHAQVELQGAKLDDNSLIQAGLNLYFRDDRGLIGFFAYRKTFIDLYTLQYALQAQRFIDDFYTVAVVVGMEDREITDDYAFAALMLRLYPTENFMADSGISHLAPKGEYGYGEVSLKFTIEWQPKLLRKANLSLFLENRIEELRTLGVRWYFGKHKTLIRRHRENGIYRLR